MAKARRTSRSATASRFRPAALLSTLAVGAVTASVGIAAPSAFADEDYPSWNDVEQAKGTEATKLAEIENLTGLLDDLSETAAETSRTSLIAAEAYRLSQDDLDEAVAREDGLLAQASRAEATAATSKLRAGLIAAHLAKTGAQNLSLNLFLNGNTAEDLLKQLGTASKLSEQSETIYRQATQDKNTAESLAEQAASAAAERTRLSNDLQAAYATANDTAAAAQAAYEVEQKKSTELYEQLALLKDTTAEAERAYKAEVDAVAAAAALAKAQANAQAQAAADAAANAGNNSGGAPAQPVPAQSAPAQPAPAQPAQPAQPTTPEPSTPAPAPNGSAVDTALAFARAQLGDRYVLGGAGPDVWDCSGLTKAAYAAAGIYIGTHSATNQYRTMANAGRLVPFGEAQVGDLVFWGVPGNYYHVAIYVGSGMILEAPNPNAPVRIHSIWTPSDVAPYVGRPSG